MAGQGPPKGIRNEAQVRRWAILRAERYARNRVRDEAWADRYAEGESFAAIARADKVSGVVVANTIRRIQSERRKGQP